MENTITVWVDGAEILQTNLPGLPDGKGKFGVRYTGGAGADIYNLTVRTANPLETAVQTGEGKTIASDKMTVTLDSAFPQVISYELDGKTLPGQEKPYYAVEINNKTVVPTVGTTRAVPPPGPCPKAGPVRPRSSCSSWTTKAAPR